jgi:hypothetical protein
MIEYAILKRALKISEQSKRVGSIARRTLMGYNLLSKTIPTYCSLVRP